MSDENIEIVKKENAEIVTEKKRGVYNYANGFFLSLVRCTTMDDEIHEQSHACTRHITAH